MKVLNTDTRESRPFTYVAFGFTDDFYSGDMNKVPKDGYQNELILPISARGYMYQMFKNPHHNETLFRGVKNKKLSLAVSFIILCDHVMLFAKTI